MEQGFPWTAGAVHGTLKDTQGVPPILPPRKVPRGSAAGDGEQYQLAVTRPTGQHEQHGGRVILAAQPPLAFRNSFIARAHLCISRKDYDRSNRSSRHGIFPL